MGVPDLPSREAVRELLEGASGSVALLDGQGTIVAVNAAWRAFAEENEASPPTVAGMGLNYLSACLDARDEAAKAALARLTELLAGRRQAFSLEYRCHSPTMLRWFQLEGRRASVPEPLYVLVHSDVTRAVRAEQHLRLQSAFTAAVVQGGSFAELANLLLQETCDRLDWDLGAIWEPGADGRLRCTQVYCRTSGLSEFERVTRAMVFEEGAGLPGRTLASRRPEWMQVLEPVKFPRAAIAHAAGLRSGFAFPLLAFGEANAVLEFFSRVTRPPETTSLALLGVLGERLGEHARRVQAEAQAAEAAKETERTRAFLDALLASAPLMVLAVNSAGEIQFLNRALSGPAASFQGRDWLDGVPASYHQPLRDALRAVFETGQTQTLETSAPGPNGQMRFATNVMSPLRHGGEVTGMVVVSQDITEKKRLQADMLQADRLASVGTLAAGVAHEINTPVQFVSDSLHFLREAAQGVFGLLEPLLEQHQALKEGRSVTPGLPSRIDEALESADLEYTREQVPKAFERCVEGLGRVANIVRSMKEFTHTQQEMAPADLNRAIESTLVIAHNETKYVAEVDKQLGELPPVVCQVGDVSRVVLNLVVNAAHAIADKEKGSGKLGRITVRTAVEGPMALISIADTGGGIPEAIRRRVFEPFFTTKEVGRGTGQGLSMAWATVTEQHLGTLTFETEVGVGTTFNVRLPLAGPSPKSS